MSLSIKKILDECRVKLERHRSRLGRSEPDEDAVVELLRIAVTFQDQYDLLDAKFEMERYKSDIFEYKYNDLAADVEILQYKIKVLNEEIKKLKG